MNLDEIANGMSFHLKYIFVNYQTGSTPSLKEKVPEVLRLLFGHRILPWLSFSCHLYDLQELATGSCICQV